MQLRMGNVTVAGDSMRQEKKVGFHGDRSHCNLKMLLEQPNGDAIKTGAERSAEKHGFLGG